MRKLTFSTLAIALAMAVTPHIAVAQEQTADIVGRLTDASGKPVAGVVVTATHDASGSALRATTDGEGRYRIHGLRAGGPYTISTDSAGTAKGVTLSLDEDNRVDLAAGVAKELDAVVVIGSLPTLNGTGSYLTADAIKAAPTNDGTITNTVRLDPHFQVINRATNEFSVLGQNPRYNAIRLDGIDVGDTFGLEPSNQPTPRQPFMLDAIEGISVKAVDYDASTAGAAGGVINAVTRSGTNEFHGSVFGTYRDHSMVRDNANGSAFSGFDTERSYGLTFGGPLVRDRLFFFIDAEDYRLRSPSPSYGPIGSGATNIVNVTQAEIDAVRAIALNKWKFDPGTIGEPSDADTTAKHWGIKLDWNITDDHRLVYRHASTDQSQANFPGFASNQLAFSSYRYQRDFDLDSDVLQVLSQWNDRFSTDASVSYRRYVTERIPNSRIPAVAVLVNPSAILFMGTEENSYLNRLETGTWNAAFSGQLAFGAHELKAGVDWSRNDIDNLYGRRINGTYGFFGLQYFNAGIATPFRFSYPAGGDSNSMAADWALSNLGLYLQDTWMISDRLTITAGLRYDRSSVGDSPIHNAGAQTAFGYDNRETLDGEGLLQPRLSFNYDKGDGFVVRGGVGLFRGQAPDVWLSNPFSNTGLNYIDYNFPVFPGFNPDPDNQIAGVPAAAPGATQSIDLIDPNLDQPSIWKANLAVENDLPWWGARGSIELVLASVDQGIYYQNLNLGNATASGQDGRALYWNAAGLNPASWNQAGTGASAVRARAGGNPAFSDVLVAKPTGKGESQQLTLQIDKPFQGGAWSWMASYTFTHATDVGPLGSTNSASLWGGRTSFDPNANISGRSIYEIKDRFTAALNWQHNFFGDFATTASLFYEGRSGRPYSYVYDNDANGDGVAGNDLLYIPSGPGDVVFGSQAEEAAFFAMVDGDPYLRMHRGSVVTRNGARAGWVNQFDLRLRQEFPGFSAGHKSELWIDVLNVGNLLNKRWGHVEDLQYPANLGVVEFGGVCGATPAGRCTAGSAGKYVYRFNSPDTLSIYDERGVSRWSVQVGIRYEF